MSQLLFVFHFHFSLTASLTYCRVHFTEEERSTGYVACPTRSHSWTQPGRKPWPSSLTTSGYNQLGRRSLPLIWKGIDRDSLNLNLPHHPTNPQEFCNEDSLSSAPSTSKAGPQSGQQIRKIPRFRVPPLSLGQPAVTSWGSAFLPSRTYPNPPQLPNPASGMLHHTPDLSGRPHHQNNHFVLHSKPGICKPQPSPPS